MNKKEIKRILYNRGIPYRILNEFSMKELKQMKDKQLTGSGLMDYFDPAYPLKKAFQVSSNIIRKAQQTAGEPNVRLLDYNELHPTVWNSMTQKFESPSYCGPNTNLKDYGNFPCNSPADCVCRQHDFAYRDAQNEPDIAVRQRLIRKADTEMINKLRDLPNKEMIQLLALSGIKGKNILEDTMPEALVKKFLPGDKYYGKK